MELVVIEILKWDKEITQSFESNDFFRFRDVVVKVYFYHKKFNLSKFLYREPQNNFCDFFKFFHYHQNSPVVG
jgi:hypothetical protein